ncbi:DNA-binding transcriptional regulator, LysR family [Sinosporangium album]|uniref:DNA-binding transcriptional regulator, LysR family n=1 Tax=Sinosporangium album TaxID=504805 RepID=A0A1G7QXS3_9ACTN|nr:LysR family transcriptional regulator [Sinosporangium album]SDG02679.1 DNA-binding transcriptional regulator, LysR family [Sinosporangium album]
MERREIEVFLTLAEELHFRRTAERLHLSTARISQSVKELERHIGTRLFERTSRRVALTPIGRQLLEDLRPGYDQICQGIALATAAGRGITGLLRIDVLGATGEHFLVRAARLFRHRHPGCEVRIRQVRLGEHLTSLRDGETELLFTGFPVHEPDLTAGPVLFREPRARRRTRAASPRRQPYALDPADEPGAVTTRLTRTTSWSDVVYVPFRNAVPLHWRLIRRVGDETHQMRAFAQAARDTAETGGLETRPRLPA